MVDSESKWSPDPKDGASSEVSEEGTASTVQTQQSSSIVTLPPLGKVKAKGLSVRVVGRPRGRRCAFEQQIEVSPTEQCACSASF